jgi:hypothetical protein
MALSKDFTFKSKYGVDVVISNCYIKVDSVNVTKSSATAIINFINSEKSCVIEELLCQFAYDITGENPIKQAYLHLKTLPEFLNATDC